MENRRTFIRNFAGVAGLFTLPGLPKELGEIYDDITRNIPSGDPGIFGSEEDFWRWIRECYTVSPNVVNLNNGGVSPQPKVVQDALERYNKIANEGPSYYMWGTLGDGRESVRQKLAAYAGCDPEEIAINRNTTEAMNTVIFGLNLRPGDEVIVAKQDYPNLLNAWKQREKREGIKLVWLSFKLPLENDEEIVETYRKAITPKTKVIMVMHMINYTGQIMPVKKIADMAHEKGIEIMVDGAHTLSHIPFKVSELNCDYFGSSLHKWTSAPFGTGLLYIRKDKIKDVWALLSDNEPDSDNIRKFESLGTRSFPIELAISHAIDFQEYIGIERKVARMRQLKNYWAEKLVKNPRVRLFTSFKPEYSCGLATFGVEGFKAADISSKLISKYKIHTTSMTIENVEGVRVTPNVYTAFSELDRFVDAVEKIIAEG